MVLIVRAALMLAGLLFVVLGGTFLLDPIGQGGDFGVSPNGNRGLSTIRADFTAYFWIAGGSLIIGAWRRDRTLLLVAAAIMAITCIVRGVSLVLDGPYDGWSMPMAVEAFVVIIALFGSRALPQSANVTDQSEML